MVTKKMTKLLVTLLFSVLMLCSCKQQKQDADVIIIDDDDAIEVNFEDVATNVRVEPLIGDTIIGECYEMKCYGNELFIRDRNGAIYYFIDNVFKSKLRKVGRGSGEYIYIECFAYDKEENILFIKPIADNSILWFSVPDMHYIKKTQLSDGICSLCIHDENNFVCSVSNDTICSLQLINKVTGESTKWINKINTLACGRSFQSFGSYRPNYHYLTITDYTNNVCSISKEGNCKTLLIYEFGDKSIPKNLIDFQNNEDQKIADLFNYMISNKSKGSLYGCEFLRIDDEIISFWFNNFSLQDKEKKCYFRHSKNTNTIMKGFHVPGLNKPIIPMCITDDGYAMAFEGTSDMIIDPDTELSPLAKQIIKAMDSQKDDNPVLVYFKLK